MPGSSDYPTILNAIKEKLDSQSMSVLVGAGFSKNFNGSIFPNWWELIFDMVRETEEEVFKEQFAQSHKGKSKKPKAYEEFLKIKIERHIEARGPLQVVSDYIKRKGFREAVDVKIEEQTPVIDIENGERFITYTEAGEVKRRPVEKGEIRIHQKLVSLPWNNIYTTNYDNLLEKSVDVAISEELKLKIEQLQAQIKTDNKVLQEKKEALGVLENKISTLRDQIDEWNDRKLSASFDPGPSPDDEDQLKKLNADRGKLKNEINFKENHELKNKTARLSTLQRNYNLGSSVVTYSSQLAVKKNGNIIKIHGSVRTKEASEYGFDSDARMHYVISKEDFETYPVKHEAFTQLMRISLLQESFCLMGFSGVDPNFLAWIGWVRDIIERKKNTGQPVSDKIYLIDVHAGPANAERTLFHDNHRIAFVPLGHPDCIAFLQNETGRDIPPEPEPEQLIELFLDYLSIDARPNKYKVAFEDFQREEYLDVWKKAGYAHDDQAKADNLELFSKGKEIVRLKQSNRIPADLYYNDNKYFFLIRFEEFIKKFKQDKELTGNLLDLARIIIEEQFLPRFFIFHDDANLFPSLLQTAKALSHRAYPYLLLIDLKDAVWLNDKPRVVELAGEIRKFDAERVLNELSYLQALHAAFNLDFSGMNKVLDNWEPQETWLLKKAGLIAITDAKKALKILLQDQQPTVQENLYQLELMAYLSLSAGDFNRRSTLIQQIKSITDEGLKRFDYNIDLILEKLNRHEHKVIPYGYDKYVESNTIIFGGSNGPKNSVVLFNMLAEGGFPLSIPMTYYKKFEEVHAAFVLAYPFIPYPVLFYVFQYSDEKLIIKMAQDYTFNPLFNAPVMMIFQNIEKLYDDSQAPHSFKRNGLTFLSELINVIEPALWQPFFTKVWNDQKSKKELFSQRPVYKNYFVEKAIHYITDTKIAAMVINDCLVAILENDPSTKQNTVIQYLYEINFNYSVNTQGEVVGELLDKASVKTLTELISGSLDVLFILGNINFALDKRQQQEIHGQLAEVRDFTTHSERVWRIVLYFAKNDEKIISQIKTNIIRSPKLWDAGFTAEGSLTQSNAYISLYKLRKFKDNNGFDWDENEVIVIYGLMLNSLSKIESWQEKHPEPFFGFKSIAQEMNWFLTYEKETLQALDTYSSTVTRVEQLYTHEKRYQKLIEGLLSHEKDQFVSALNEISYEIYNYHQFEANQFHIQTILHKLLLESKPGLAEALGTLTGWMMEFREQEQLRQYEGLLIELLTSYEGKMPSQIDLPYVQEKIITLAFVLKSWGNDSEIVNKTLKLLESSRFNEIRYNLRLQLQSIN